MLIVQEIQTNSGHTSLLTPLTFDNRPAADSAFFYALAAAAVSTVTVHTVIMYDEYGNVLRQGHYEHQSAGSGA